MKQGAEGAAKNGRRDKRDQEDTRGKEDKKSRWRSGLGWN